MRSLLGGCLTAQKKFADAEPLLLESFQALQAAQGVPPGRLHQAADRIIRLYEAWDKKAEAEEWRKKLAGLPRNS